MRTWERIKCCRLIKRLGKIFEQKLTICDKIILFMMNYKLLSANAGAAYAKAHWKEGYRKEEKE